MKVAAPDARAGDNIDERIKVNVSKQRVLKTWPSETTFSSSTQTETRMVSFLRMD